MTEKRLIRHAAARRDLERASDFYEDKAGPELVRRFLEAARTAFCEIATRPGVGSPRYGEKLRAPHLRTRRISRFPYLIFYVETVEVIEVIRVLHERRDIRRAFSSGLN
ncbi:MAG TPA: type II toxin-antitoxin system RelE/ParE family toxin [Allosphingosinicella sp.]